MKYLLPLFIASCLLLTACDGQKRQATQSLIKQERQEMVYVKGGSFIMGPKPGTPWVEGDAAPQHKVILDSFYISKYNVDFGKYDAYSKIVGLKLLYPVGLRFHDFYRSSKYPVFGLTWQQAHNYCHWLAQKTGLPYDLPTEAQWEYAARAGGRPNWPFSTNNGQLEPGINFTNDYLTTHQKGNTDHDQFPLPVGSLPPNPLGIYGMTGEINEWMKDWYSPTYYAHSPVHNPQGPAKGTLRATRGGGAIGDRSTANDYARNGTDPTLQWAGFRCVINSSLPPNQLGDTAAGK